MTSKLMVDPDPLAPWIGGRPGDARGRPRSRPAVARPAPAAGRVEVGDRDLRVRGGQPRVKLLVAAKRQAQGFDHDVLLGAVQELRIVFQQGRQVSSGTLQAIARRAGGLTCRGMNGMTASGSWACGPSGLARPR